MNFAYIVSKETSSWIPKLGKNKRTILLICDDYCNFFCKWARCRRNPFFVGMIWEIRRSFVCRKEKTLWRISFITESGIYSRSCDKRVVFISEMSYSLSCIRSLSPFCLEDKVPPYRSWHSLPGLLHLCL